MAKGNDGNFLQHCVEVAAAKRLAQMDAGGRLHIALTHGMAPLEPLDKPKGASCGLLKGALNASDRRAQNDEPAIVKAYRQVAASDRSYPNTAELLAAAIERNRLSGGITECDSEKHSQLAERWRGSKVTPICASWRREIAPGGVLACPDNLRTPWLFSMDPMTYSEKGNADDDKLHRADISPIADALTCYFDSGKPGIAAIFVYSVGSQPPNRRRQFWKFMDDLRQRISTDSRVSADIAVSSYWLPHKGGNRNLAGLIYSGIDLSSELQGSGLKLGRNGAENTGYRPGPRIPRSPMTDFLPIERALISVSDKTGLIGLAQALAALGVEILSTGGTAQALRAAGIAVTEVSDSTGHPEILDGRVKTLHPSIHGGILARRDDESHRAALAAHGIAGIDLVAVNLYPFESAVAQGGDFETCVENIDIGGPALIRAAAKNHAFVTVLADPADYPTFLSEYKKNRGSISADLRRSLAARAYARTAAYDSAISRWFAEQDGEPFPEQLTLAGRRRQILRYGENPHQAAAFYAGDAAPYGVADAVQVQVQGKALSYNNIADADAAWELAAEFDRPTVVIVKHANPCGVASADSVADAWPLALSCDPVSAFGGVIACNRPLDGAAAERIAEIFSEVIIAPDADTEARRILAGKKNLRLLLTEHMPDRAADRLTVRSVAGGFLVQSRDTGVTSGDLAVKTRRVPTKNEVADMLFAFTVCKHVKSNAIVYARDRRTVGIGAGQMSRVDAARIAAQKAEDAARAAGLADSPVKGSVAASDAFFPFPDGLLAAAEAGATAVIQPGGSVRDDEVIAAADERGLAMVFTGVRHFRH